jgi:hypothetical protein
MNHPKPARILIFALCIAGGLAARDAAAGPSAAPSPAGGAQVPVTLFGQPCVLSGPFSPDQLKAIHAISPEQMPYLEPGQATAAQEKLKRMASVPSALDGYRDQLRRRLEAQTAWDVAIAQARKDGKLEPVLAIARQQLAGRRQRSFVAAARKLAHEQAPARWAATQVEALTEAWNDAVPTHPEEEFHRAIRVIGVKYACAYEEGEGDVD